jgi:tetratricopeptide (TPR) repeat protein
VRLYAKAVEALRAGLDIEPRSLDLREMLRDVLLEAGNVEGAVLEMLDLAALYVDSLDGDAAARCLQDVLAYDPPNARARAMLHELGYEVIDEPEQPPEELAPSESEQFVQQRAPDFGGGGYDEPLPSYELDEASAADAAPAYVERSVTAPDVLAGRALSRAPAPQPIAEMDDPFLTGDVAAPLPSFPLESGPESAAAFDLVDRDQPQDDFGDEGLGDTSQEPVQLDVMGEPAPASPAAPPAAAASPELEEALEEAEFFASRGLYDDARNILVEQLERLPKHPLLRERLEELKAQENAKRGSGARERPSGPLSDRAAADRAFDIAASLDALEQGDAGDVGPAAFHEPEEQVDVEEVFAKFKEGVAKQISVDDAQSHYDLGVAYKEMGLLEDAVREFEVAARDARRECVCRSMIGMIQIERGNINEAIDAFMRGLKAKMRNSEQETVLEFEVAACYETKRMTAKALEFYQKAARRDPGYRDVQDRIRKLKGEQKPALRAAVGADDEFDRAFDDLLGGGKP